MTGCCNHSILLASDCFLCLFRSFPRRPSLGIYINRDILSRGMNLLKYDSNVLILSDYKIHTYPLIEIFSIFQALLVFILYVRCTAINPADPGIMSKFDSRITQSTNPNNGLSEKGLPGRFEDEMHSSISSASRSTRLAANSSMKESTRGNNGTLDITTNTSEKSCCAFGGILCAVFVHQDCRNSDKFGDDRGSGDEEALFCTLCNAEVLNMQK